MKKIICLLSALCILLCFCGCESLGKKPITLADSMPVPDDGIISAEILNSLKEENKAVIFIGTSGNVKYEWVVFGSDTVGEDINLGLEITEARNGFVAFKFLSDKSFGFSPALSIYLDEPWSAQGALLQQGGEAVPVSVSGKGKGILTFSPTVQTGECVIVPDGEIQEDASSADILSADTSSTNTSSVDTSSVDTSSADTSSADTSSVETSSVDTSSVDTSSVDTSSDISDDISSEQSENSSHEESAPDISDDRPVSDGTTSGQDRYQTDPVPEGKPLPVEPSEGEIDKKKEYSCTFSIECTTILSHLSELEPEKLDVLPPDGIIFPQQTVTFYEGESVFDVLQRVCRENKIHLESSFTPMYNSAYVEGINNIYEFDCGGGSGWMYRVDGWYPNYGCSRYQLKDGEKVEWRFTCDMGNDIGGGYAVGD